MSVVQDNKEVLITSSITVGRNVVDVLSCDQDLGPWTLAPKCDSCYNIMPLITRKPRFVEKDIDLSSSNFRLRERRHKV